MQQPEKQNNSNSEEAKKTQFGSEDLIPDDSNDEGYQTYQRMGMKMDKALVKDDDDGFYQRLGSLIDAFEFYFSLQAGNLLNQKKDSTDKESTIKIPIQYN